MEGNILWLFNLPFKTHNCSSWSVARGNFQRLRFFEDESRSYEHPLAVFPNVLSVIVIFILLAIIFIPDLLYNLMIALFLIIINMLYCQVLCMQIRCTKVHVCCSFSRVSTHSFHPFLNSSGDQSNSSCPLLPSMIDQAVYQVSAELWSQKHQ